MKPYQLGERLKVLPSWGHRNSGPGLLGQVLVMCEPFHQQQLQSPCRLFSSGAEGDLSLIRTIKVNIVTLGKINHHAMEAWENLPSISILDHQRDWGGKLSQSDLHQVTEALPDC